MDATVPVSPMVPDTVETTGFRLDPELPENISFPDIEEITGASVGVATPTGIK